MVNEKILEFYGEFRDEVLGYVKENGPIQPSKLYFCPTSQKRVKPLFRTAHWWISKKMARI